MSKIWSDLQKQFRKVSEKALAAAAGAAGTGLVTLAVWGGTALYEHYARERWVGILSQPDDEIAATPTVAASSACGTTATPAALKVSVAHHQEVEFWDRTMGASFSARITSENGVGHGEVSGYDIPRDGGPAIDSIVAAFKGQRVGRGVYDLERTYRNGAATSPDTKWWRGTHLVYDCQNARTLRCPYLLGPASLRSEMASDSWLSRTCTVEPLPSTEALAQRSAAN